MPILAMFNTPEIIALVVLAVFLFGAKKLPELAGSVGKSLKEFKKASRETEDEIKKAVEDKKSSESHT